jgi:acetyltransferase-like isoleucine patch superfamily enzyme
MNGFWRVPALWQRMMQAHYRASFIGQCQSVGKDMLVKGPFRIRNAGQIHIGDSCIIDSSKERPLCLDIGGEAVLRIGDGVYLNEGIHIVCNIAVTIGSRCLIASDVGIMDDDGHPVNWQERHNHWPTKPEDRLGAPVVIDDNVWIGTRAMILKGVHIGTGSVVGAGAIVTHSVPERTLVAGVPARMIRKIRDE